MSVVITCQFTYPSLPVPDLALIKTRRKSFYWVKLGEIRFHILTQSCAMREFTYNVKRMWSNTFIFRLLSFRYFKLGNWVCSQETNRVHLWAIVLILILVGGLLIKEAALRFFGIILVHRWSCLLMLNKPTHTRISWVLHYKLFQFSLGNNVFWKKYCSLQPWRQWIKYE